MQTWNNINFCGYNRLKTWIEKRKNGSWSDDHWYGFYLKPFPAVVQPIVVEDIEPIVMQTDVRR